MHTFFFNCDIFSFSGMLLLLTPLFKYMFLHPSPSSEHLMVSSYLHTSLLSLAESLSREEDKSQAKLLLQALTNLLPLSPTLNHNSTLTLINHIEVIVHYFLIFFILYIYCSIVFFRDRCPRIVYVPFFSETGKALVYGWRQGYGGSYGWCLSGTLLQVGGNESLFWLSAELFVWAGPLPSQGSVTRHHCLSTSSLILFL